MQRCRCEKNGCNPGISLCHCGSYILAFSAGMVVALLLSSGKAVFLVAIGVGCAGAAMLRR